MRKSAWILTSLFVLIAAGVGFISYSNRQHELASKELAQIDHCADSTERLFVTASLVQSTLYPDVDHFLGKTERVGEAQAKECLASVYGQANSDAHGFHPRFSERLGGEARDMFVVAEQMETLAASPSGTWLSNISEVAKARSRYQEARTRFELDRGRKIDQEEDMRQAKVALAPYSQVLKMRIAAETAKLEASLADTQERISAMAAQPQPLETQLGFEWKTDDTLSNETRALIGQADILVVKNLTSSRIYKIGITFRGWDHREEIPMLEPRQIKRILILTHTVGTYHPIPVFVGVIAGGTDSRTDL